MIVGVFAMRNHCHFGGPQADYETWPYATDAATALRSSTSSTALDHGVRGLSEDDLGGPSDPPKARMPTIRWPTLVLHINREVIHHGAEIACIRDLYVHTTDTKES